MQAPPLTHQDTGLSLAPPPYEPQSEEPPAPIPFQPLPQEPTPAQESTNVQAPESSIQPIEALAPVLVDSSSSPVGNKESTDHRLAVNTSLDQSLTILPSSGSKIKKRFGNPFVTPPPCFGRAAPEKSSNGFGPFDSFAIPGRAANIGDGFHAYYPVQVFVDHDVSSAEWQVSEISPCLLSNL